MLSSSSSYSLVERELIVLGWWTTQVNVRSFGNLNPLEEYKIESLRFFISMLSSFRHLTVESLLRPWRIEMLDTTKEHAWLSWQMALSHENQVAVQTYSKTETDSRGMKILKPLNIGTGASMWSRGCWKASHSHANSDASMRAHITRINFWVSSFPWFDVLVALDVEESLWAA